MPNRATTLFMPFITAQALPIGAPMPDASALKGLPPVEKGTPVLIMSICNHCPKTVPLRHAITLLHEEFGASVSFIGIMSNDVLYCPMDGPEEMKKEAAEFKWTFPYLFDEDQSLAKAFGLALTPECLLYDAEHKLAFHGEFGENGTTLHKAISCVLAGIPCPDAPLAVGCDIKWTMPGEPPLRRPDATPNAPAYWTAPEPEKKAGEDKFHLHWNAAFESGEWSSFPVKPPPQPPA